MPTDHPDLLVPKIFERSGNTGAPARAAESAPECLNSLLESNSLDWDLAVRAAIARLNEGWVLSETTCDPAMTGIAEELAAFLCAYGLLADEVKRIRVAVVRSGRCPIVKTGLTAVGPGRGVP